MRAFAQSIVETVRHPLLILDTEMRIRSANSAFHSVFHIPEGQAEGRSLFSGTEKILDTPELRKRLTQVAAEGLSFEGFEAGHHFPDGSSKSLLLNARRVVSEEDRVPMILLAIEDITERQLARDALRQLNEDLEDRVRERTAQLEAANKEMEAFCYSVSHDLRAPLRAIDGFAQQLITSYADQIDETGRHYLVRVRSNSQRMAQLIDDLLQLSRLSRAEMQFSHVDLSNLASDVIAELRQRTPDRDVAVSIEPHLVAHADKGLMRVVLENLLGNAWKFTSKKARAAIAFGRDRDNTGSAFFVRDNGAGFEDRFANKLFGAFQRLHHERDFPGTGIGLATVQRVIRRHGGTVRAEGSVGNGATFHFTIPERDEA